MTELPQKNGNQKLAAGRARKGDTAFPLLETIRGNPVKLALRQGQPHNLRERAGARAMREHRGRRS